MTIRLNGAKHQKTTLQFLRPPWRATRFYLLRWLQIFFLSQSRASSSALAPSKKGGGGPYYYYYYYYYCYYCYYCSSCSEIGGRGINYSSYYYYYYSYYYYYYYYYYFYSPIIGRTPDITTPPTDSPLIGKYNLLHLFLSLGKERYKPRGVPWLGNPNVLP